MFVVYNEEEFFKHYLIDSLGEVNGKPAYRVAEEYKCFIIHNGKDHPKYDVYGSQEVNGKLAYRAKEGDQVFIVYDGEEQTKYDYVSDIVEIDGKLFFVAQEDEDWYIVRQK